MNNNNLNLSLDKLQAYLCNLNFYKDFNHNEYEKTNQSIEIEQKDLIIETEPEKNNQDKDLVNIPLNFENYEEYIKIWQNLFYLEVKAQIMKSRYLEVNFLFNI